MNDTKLADSKSTRRRFLVASLAFSTATVTGTTWLRGATAWAADNSDATLAQFGRLLFPINGLGDDVYKSVMSNVLSALSGNPATEDALATAESELNAASDGDWYAATEAAQISAIESIQSEPFFAAVLGTLRGAFHYDPAVWEFIQYPGSSKEHGGYLHRGFDDIDWLPESN
jgi:hypothetical protein